MVGPLGSSPTRSQTFQLVIAGCRLLSCRRSLASEPVSSLLRRSLVSLYAFLYPFLPFVLRSSLFQLRPFSPRNTAALCSPAMPFPSRDSLHRDAAVAPPRRSLASRQTLAELAKPGANCIGRNRSSKISTTLFQRMRIGIRQYIVNAERAAD